MSFIEKMPIRKIPEIKQEKSQAEVLPMEGLEKEIIDLKKQEDLLGEVKTETIIELQQKNPTFAEKLKTVLGVAGVVAGLTFSYEVFSNPDKLRIALEGLKVVGGIGFAIVSATISDLNETIHKIKI